MTENEATVLEFDNVTAISLSDILYLIQGTGDDRDKNATIEQLRDFIQINFDAFHYHTDSFDIRAADYMLNVGTPGGTTKVGGGSVVFANPSGTSTGEISAYTLALPNASVELDLVKTDGTYIYILGTSRTPVITIKPSLADKKATVTGNIDFDGDINIDGSETVTGTATFGTGTDLTTINGSSVVTHNVTALSVASANISATGTVTAGLLKGIFKSSYIGEASSDSDYADPNLLTSTSISTFPVGSIIMVKHGTGKFYNYATSGTVMTLLSVENNEAAILLCIGTDVTTTGITIPIWAKVG